MFIAVNPMLPSKYKTLVERWFKEIFEQGSLATVDEIVASDFVARGQGGSPDAYGRETFKNWLHWYRTSLASPGTLTNNQRIHRVLRPQALPDPFAPAGLQDLAPRGEGE